MSIDIITGWISAHKRGIWESGLMKNGLSKKAGVLLIILTAGLLDAELMLFIPHLPFELPFALSFLVYPFVIAWYLLAEIGSVLENCALMGIGLPPFLAPIVSLLEKGIEGTAAKAAGSPELPDVSKAEEDAARGPDSTDH